MIENADIETHIDVDVLAQMPVADEAGSLWLLK